MSKKLFFLILLAMVIAVTSAQAAVTPITKITSRRVDNPGGAPNFWLESITVGSYTVAVNRLVTGVSTGAATAQLAPYNDIKNADNFDLNLFAGRATENPPTWQIRELGGKSAWVDTNGDNPDFFVFETGGNQDFTIEPILPGGTIGRSVTVLQATFGDTGLVVTTSGPHNGQTIEGVAFAITDLLDQSGSHLTNNSMIEGIQITSDGIDPSCFCAILAGKILAAHNPTPADGALHTDTWVNLSWSPGDTAVSHDVYLGESLEDVNDGIADTFRGNQTGTFFIAGFPGFPYPDGLVPGTTYYWRIDEVEAAGTKYAGPVWSFTVPSNKAHDPIPADGAKYVDVDVTLKWTGGFGAKLHHLYLGANLADVEAGTGGTDKGPVGVASYKPVALVLGATYYWRVDEFDGAATHKGDVWSFTTIPDLPITDPDLMGWWKLDEGYGAKAIDSSGHGNHGTIQGAAEWVAGYDGGALQFDGSTNYIDVATGLAGSDAGSVAAWIKTTQSTRGMIFYGSDVTGGNGYGDESELHLNVEDGGVVEFWIEGATDVSVETSAVNNDACTMLRPRGTAPVR
jgi:hypothetical protein